jgi:hypothetical protein
MVCDRGAPNHVVLTDFILFSAQVPQLYNLHPVKPGGGKDVRSNGFASVQGQLGS